MGVVRKLEVDCLETVDGLAEMHTQSGITDWFIDGAATSTGGHGPGNDADVGK